MFTFIVVCLVITVVGLVSQKGREALLCKEDEWEKAHSIDVDVSTYCLAEEKELSSYRELGISLSSIGLVVNTISCLPSSGETVCIIEQKEVFFSPWDEEIRLGL